MEVGKEAVRGRNRKPGKGQFWEETGKPWWWERRKRGLSNGTDNVRRRKREEQKHYSDYNFCNVVGSAVCFSAFAESFGCANMTSTLRASRSTRARSKRISRISSKIYSRREIESLNICDNLADHHMIGNVYVQFKEEDQAAAALQALQGRSYLGRPIIGEFSPVTDFREATCRQYEEENCRRGGIVTLCM
ncbi:hypothetical protein F2Q69_00028147 [Brassica cretica]|uniref:RRM domain-containing protein n=1 Tax=Brassica cretica TaxID=69181 RepID=A0A8S9S6R5_BRACR|nr:hypothetical protein F2Q69_00028147 [Brassica cretica]